MHTRVNKIQFEQIRDFGQVFNTGFTFIRQHFKRLFMHLLSIGGPFLLVGVGVSALLLVRMQSWSAIPTPDAVGITSMPFSFSEIALSYAVNILSFLVGMVMITSVINAYIKLYKESPDPQPDIQLGEVWGQVRKDFWRMAGQLFLLHLMAILLFGLLAGFAFMVFTSGSSTGAKIGFGFLYFLGGFALFCYLMPYFVGLFITQNYFERTGFFESVSRVFYLIKGEWWLTFGLGFVNTIIMYVIFFVCYLPFYIVMMISMVMQAQQGDTPDFSSLTWVMVGMTVCLTVGYLVMFIVHYVMAAVHYHNLLERKEGGSLLAKIETIGLQQPVATAPTDFYDEEEKY